MSAGRYFFGRLARFLEAWPTLLSLLHRVSRWLRAVLRRLHIQLPIAPPLGIHELRRLRDETSLENPRRAGSCDVLIYSPRAWPTHVAVEQVIAHALRRRGISSMYGTCGLEMPLCNMGTIYNAPPMPCSACMRMQDDVLRDGPFRRFSKAGLLPSRAMEQARIRVSGCSYAELRDMNDEGLAIGRLVQISTRWFLASGEIRDDADDLVVYRDFVAAGLVTADAARRLLVMVEPRLVFMLSGLFFEERIMFEVARKAGIPVVTYERAFHRGHYVFARNKFACHYALDEHWPRFKHIQLSGSEQEWLDDYLGDWRSGARSHSQYWASREDRIAEVCEALGLDSSRPIVVVFTNIAWDSAVQERDVAFPNMFDWIQRTVEYVSGRPDVQLVVRIHPAEVRLEGRPTRDRVADRIRGAFRVLPDNIKVVDADSPLSSYSLVELARVVVVYSSTVGLEAAMAGRAVVVAGMTHYRGKGFTLDAEDPEQYFQLIRESLEDEDAGAKARIDLARRYAHLFFRRQMIAVNAIREDRMGQPRLAVAGSGELVAGKDADLDRICQFITGSFGQTSAEALIRDGGLDDGN